MSCHGDGDSNAPPRSTNGTMETTATAVGAHRAHVGVAATWHRQLVCSDCHAVPAEVNSPGHMDGDGKAELTFGTIAGAGAMWNGTSCTNACHGRAALGGTKPNPVWTTVDGTQSTCGSCHGAPPPPPHPTGNNCATCHPTMEEASLTFRDPASHIDGKVDVVGGGATGGCTSCHGSATSSAPPKDLSGDTAATAAGVGAHQAHLTTSAWRRTIACTSCHTVPLTADAPGHIDGDNMAELKFDTLNSVATYNRQASTCGNMYCHGNGRVSTSSASWITPGKLACTSCHTMDGTGMSGDHRRHLRENIQCSGCHADVINAGRTIINAALHVNGLHEVKMGAGTYNPNTRRCSNLACHENETW
ncbi:MAG: CxxxxCH/CxxCH domain-containing protein [Myxococcales bacterium]|nr:CxxxxCH/CxxCH domain-containing protein [Myxococcales bacterium]